MYLLTLFYIYIFFLWGGGHKSSKYHNFKKWRHIFLNPAHKSFHSQLPFKDPLPSPISSCVIRFTPTNNIQVLYPGNMFEDSSPTKKLQLMSQTIYVQQCLSKVTPALTKCQVHTGFIKNVLPAGRKL